jgi:hypothetical protein
MPRAAQRERVVTLRKVRFDAGEFAASTYGVEEIARAALWRSLCAANNFKIFYDSC